MVGERTQAQAKTVPLRVRNESSQRKRPTVTFIEQESNGTLFSKTIGVAPGTDRRFEVGPINPQTRYSVSFEVGNQGGEEIVVGNEVRAVELTIRNNGRAGMMISVTDEPTSS